MKTAHSQTILILGGGLMGLAIAHQLARRGKTVQVISRRRSEAAGFVAAGMLAPHAEGLCGDLLELGQTSLKLTPQWVKQIEEDSGLRCGLRTNGIVVPFLNSDERDAYPTADQGQRLNRTELSQELPNLSARWQTALLFEQDGQIDNRRRLMRALERACTSLGVSFLEGANVQHLLQNNHGALNGVMVQTAEGEQQQLMGDQAVLCCGAWSRSLLPQLPVFPVKGQMLSLQGPRDAIKRVIFGPGTYMVPREDGLIVVGATSEKGAGFSEGLTPDGQKQLQAGIASLVPDARHWPPMERWWGFRPCTPDEAPLLGSSPIEGLWLATGHHRNGVLLAAITAHLLGDLITGVDRTVSPGSRRWTQAFHWTRFDRDDIARARESTS